MRQSCTKGEESHKHCLPFAFVFEVLRKNCQEQLDDLRSLPYTHRREHVICNKMPHKAGERVFSSKK